MVIDLSAGSSGSHIAQPVRWTPNVLSFAAALWFVTAVAGQWVFVYYLADFYGPTFISGEFADWDRNRGPTDSYIAGDVAGNLVFAAHVALAAILTFGGTLQLVPQLRQHAIAFHRWNGRLFVIVAIAAALAGLYLEWVRGTAFRAPTGLTNAAAITLNATLILVFTGLAWRAVRAKQIASHQCWATRLFLVVNGTWFTRIGIRAWMVLTGGFGADTFFMFWAFGAFLLPLAVYELYQRARVSSAPVQLAMAAGLVVLTLIMAIGTVTTFLEKWLPLISL